MGNNLVASIKSSLERQHRETIIKDSKNHLIIMVDVSGSMNELQKDSITKLDQLKSCLTIFYQTCQFKIHLISFSDSAQQSSGEFLDDLLTLTSHGSTILSEGLRAGLDMATEIGQLSRAILLSDGQITENEDVVWSYVYLYKNKNVPIDTIGFGMGVNERLLKGIAELTGGTYQHADNLSGVLSKLLNIEIKAYLEWNREK